MSEIKHNEENPWITKSSEIKYDNPWIKVTEHQVINPAGNDGIYGTVHFKNLAIGIVPVDEDMNTWLVGQYRYPLDEYTWEIPEGGGKLGVPPLESAKRELLEEVGLEAASWEIIQESHLSNSVSDEKGILYLAQDLTYKQPNPDEEEELQLKKLPLKEAVQMVLDGKITDSLSVMALLKVKLILNL